MAKRDWSAQLEQVTFACGVCVAAKTWTGVPDLVAPSDDPDDAHHPYRYFAHCPRCLAKHQPQAAWERALLKAHQASTGPRTAEGMARTAANLEGHPTPEETRRIRFNAMKHGSYARTATYFPARPGQYALCATCEVDKAWCAQQAACVKRVEVFMLHHAAFDQRNPKILGPLHADLQASLVATLQMLLQEVLADGAVIRVPKVELSRDGRPITLTYEDEAGETVRVHEISSHPALKPIADLVSRLGLSTSDLAMTVRSADPEEADAGGRLVVDEDTKETLDGFGQRMLLAMENARGMLQRSAARTEADPVLVAHQAAEGKAPGAAPALPAGGRGAGA